MVHRLVERAQFGEDGAVSVEPFYLAEVSAGGRREWLVRGGELRGRALCAD
ncbi:hypothetical protein [Streptomyces sp. NPDC058620]|uniref:hypothetical protein n=1 Tax=Streptomyces sp. NPDC058620 TaxID=3346560 RepID=UPI00365DABFA